MGLFDVFKKNKKVGLTEEQLKWNEIWKRWANGEMGSPYAELMTYQSEINNGGHAQYFSNVENTGDLQEQMSALEQILSEKLLTNLKKAYKAYLTLEENEDDEKAEEVLGQCDNIFYKDEEEINCLLKEYCLTIEL